MVSACSTLLCPTTSVSLINICASEGLSKANNHTEHRVICRAYRVYKFRYVLHRRFAVCCFPYFVEMLTGYNFCPGRNSTSLARALDSNFVVNDHECSIDHSISINKISRGSLLASFPFPYRQLPSPHSSGDSRICPSAFPI